ncbi:glutathione S-transferase [Neisseria dentiae]|uniref:Glutathione S-transferase n=1 Tax=Neisseria dentiae TaxID=194197 RepID=A0A1X3DC51_9NEIS|nr:glutathione S-transferase family protein [Neisseria dentiae]OSI17483.1 glutathione S-transferase [Neisseria dentiae]QMT45876.1 glutathione S-transferase family protein [Neisseria dentiae]STZ51873.1 Glutathione S-transferase [Neisseria dentiae]
MTAQLTFYTNPMSRGRVARWMLEETGLPYDTVLLDYGTTMKAPEYRAVNPMGKVPALKHGDTVITETAAICLYLADLVPEKKLAPPVGSPERGSYYRWISFMAPLEQLMTAKAGGSALPKQEMAGFGTEQDLLDTLEAALKDREYLAGSSFTAADLLVAAYVGWYLQFKLLEPRPAFAAFAERHQQRPAARRADEIDEALLAQQPS